ncbi:hypothetical protein [Pelagicoccus sp. SDUM812002]|uniref:hypothetical protein n=1 Tax=Pelagicoccus sp. SDUM812002 TaxID=3041266 RepID=UPI00280D4821|nr:hypothetical protein [Pelagicoccus sp. SDUM812002]MDQ8184661.1 hypothetical protein [Pelagicoccus sp. SDUM812002]
MQDIASFAANSSEQLNIAINGEGESNYRLERSTDLQTRETIQSFQGTLNFELDFEDVEPDGHVFYRAVLE